MNNAIDLLIMAISFYYMDMKSGGVFESGFLPLIFIFALGHLIYNYYKLRDHDDPPSHPEGGF